MAASRNVLTDISNVYEHYSKDISLSPPFLYSTVEHYLTDITKRTKAYKYFIEGYVQKLVYCNNLTVDCSLCCYKARCLPSQKKGSYVVKAILKKPKGEIESADCGCPAGLSGDCHHVGALLFVIADLKLRGHTTIPDDKSCTDLPCTWINPKAGTKSGKPVSKLDIVKLKKIPEKENFGAPLKRKLKDKHFDPRQVGQRDLDVDGLIQLHKRLKFLLPECAFVTNFDEDRYTLLDPVSAVPGPSKSLGLEETEVLSRTDASVDLIQNPIQSDEFQTAVHKYLDLHYPPITEQDQEGIASATIKQSQNPVWHIERRKRLTASNFKSVSTMSCDPDKLLKRMLYAETIQTYAMKRGISLENEAADFYKQEMFNKGVKVHLQQCGVIVDRKKPFLGASPDRIVSCLDSLEVGLLEIKCPLSDNALKPNTKGSCLTISADGQTQLKKNHAYYFQIQGQLGISNFTWCDFLIYKKNEHYIERIYFSECFWNQMLQSILHFVHYAFVPELILRNVRDGKNLYSMGAYSSYKNSHETMFFISASNGLKISLKKWST